MAFYRDKLGFEEAFAFRDNEGRWFGQYFHIGAGTFLELFVGKHADPAEEMGYRHFCLEVDDIAAESDRLRAAGVEVGDIKTGSGNSLQMWITDPDGNRIEFHQYTPAGKQHPFV